ncbi:fimbria/pilus outer membrane usher protein [Serratia marcescens]|uniref:fimbria/pilus outer membrane usher protein n=1 Tax=Serratia marcescens TaxID=615 RepID=UPI0006613CB5
MICLLLAGLGSEHAQARDYFDPAFLGDGGSAPIDLSAFETAGLTPEGSYLVDIYLNGDKQATRQVRFVKDAQGNVNPQVTPAELGKWGVALDRVPALKALPADKPVGDLTQVVSGATVKFSLNTLRLDLTVPQADMLVQADGAVDPQLWDEGVPALLFSYMLNGTQSRTTGPATSTSQSLFGSVNGGLNLGAWRLRTSMTWSQSDISAAGGRYSSRQSQFNSTYLQRDVSALRGDLTLGEISSGGTILDSIPLRGVKLVSDNAMLPTGLRGFSPVITGTASSNARVSVAQNGSVIYEASVPPGPFRLTDIHNAGNGGELVVTVTEADGTRHVSSQTYSTLPDMQRQGAFDYEVTAGRYRNGGYTDGARDPLFALGTLSVGLPHYLTLFGGLLGSTGYQQVALGLGASLGALGALSVDTTLARAQLGQGTGNGNDSSSDGSAGAQGSGPSSSNGASFRVRYTKSMTDTGTTIDLAAYRYSTRGYYSFQDAMAYGQSLREGAAPWLAERQRSSWVLSLSQSLGELGSLSLRGSRTDYWGTNRVVNSLSAGFNSSIKGVGYSLNYDVDHTSSTGSDSWPTNRQLSLNVSVPFSIFNPSAPAVQDINANYSMTRDNHGRVSQQAGMSGALLDGNLSWGVSQSEDNQQSGRSGNLSLGYSGGRGSLGLGYGYAPANRTLSMNASGGVVVHPHGVTLTRMLGDAMALVEVPGAGGVGVSGGGTTDGRGYAVVPYLQNYQRNSVSLDTSTLPDGVDVGGGSATVYPTKGALVEAKFKTRVGRQAMLTLTFRGRPVPFGALAALPDDEVQNAAIVGDGGLVYLTGAPQKGVLTVSWGQGADRQCRVPFDLGGLPAANAQGAPAVNIAQQALTCLPLPGAPAPAPDVTTEPSPATEMTTDAEATNTAETTKTAAPAGATNTGTHD